MCRKLSELWKPKGKMRIIDLPRWYFMIKFDEDTDYMNVLVGGPWLVFGHYVVIKPWSPNLNPLTDVVTNTPAWIRLMDLPVVFYEHNVLLQLASAVDVPIKVDHRTLFANKGRFARICVELDLTKPLKGTMVINGARTLIEYEGLHTICFRCDHFGNFQTSCPQDLAVMAWREEATKAKLLNQIDTIQNSISIVVSNELLAANDQLLKDLDLVLSQEETLWKQNSRELCLLCVDRNTSYFHASTVIQLRRNRVETLKKDWIFDRRELEEIVVDFFRKLYHVPLEEL
ncbi:hypothetical protein V2J09_015651 [Rumex salicifolius]